MRWAPPRPGGIPRDDLDRAGIRDRLWWGLLKLQMGANDVELFLLLFWVTGELSTLRQMMKVPNEPGLSPNNGLENAFLSDQSMASNPRKGQAKRFGAKTTSHDGKAGHVMTHVCHRARQEQRQVRPCKRRCRKHAPLHLAQRLDRLNCRAKQCQVSTSS